MYSLFKNVILVMKNLNYLLLKLILFFIVEINFINNVLIKIKINSGLVKESIAPLSDNLTIKVITVDGEKTLQCLAIQQNQ